MLLKEVTKTHRFWPHDKCAETFMTFHDTGCLDPYPGLL